MGYPYDTDELFHHGIKGQRWGIRRYQNQDGSLTSAGKSRYDDGDSSPGAKQPKMKHRDKLIEKYKSQGMDRQ